MTDYILTTERLRLVKKNDRDKVTARKTFNRGDTITEADQEKFSEVFSEDRIATLLDRGSLVDAEDGLPDEEEQSAARAAAVVGGITGAATAPSEDHSDIDEDNPDDDGFPEDSGKERPENWSEMSDDEKMAYVYGDGEEHHEVPFDPDNPEDVDQYTEMDYPTLQATAKQRGLNAGGGAEDLRIRLREADAS